MIQNDHIYRARRNSPGPLPLGLLCTSISWDTGFINNVNLLTGLLDRISITLGYSRNYPDPPYGRHWIWFLNISGFPRRTTAVFTGSQSLLIQNLEEFQNFTKLWMVFLEFRLKFTKFWENLWISSHTHWAFLTGFPMSSMRGVWIFSGIAYWWLWCQICSKYLHQKSIEFSFKSYNIAQGPKLDKLEQTKWKLGIFHRATSCISFIHPWVKE